MKKALLTLTLFLSSPMLACDETCHENVMQKHGVDLAAYLTTDYCQETSVNFLLKARDSLANYRETKLPEGHKGGIRNIRDFLRQRKQWLQECDNYLMLTDQGRVFSDEETTQRIFQAIESVARELDRLMGVGRSVRLPASKVAGADQRLEHLFTAIDNHRTELQLRGQLVIR